MGGVKKKMGDENVGRSRRKKKISSVLFDVGVLKIQVAWNAEKPGSREGGYHHRPEREGRGGFVCQTS